MSSGVGTKLRQQTIRGVGGKKETLKIVQASFASLCTQVETLPFRQDEKMLLVLSLFTISVPHPLILSVLLTRPAGQYVHQSHFLIEVLRIVKYNPETKVFNGDNSINIEKITCFFRQEYLSFVRRLYSSSTVHQQPVDKACVCVIFQLSDNTLLLSDLIK